MYKRRALYVIPCVLFLESCHGATGSDATSTPLPPTTRSASMTSTLASPTPSTPSAASTREVVPLSVRITRCRHASASASSNHTVPVDSPGAPTVGPLSFHLYPYQSGQPTKMIIHAVRTQIASITLTGFNCTDGRPLHFAYNGQLAGVTGVQLGSRLVTYGTAAEHLAPIRVGTDHTGYVLFTETGRWLVQLESDTTNLGSILLNVGSHK